MSRVRSVSARGGDGSSPRGNQTDRAFAPQMALYHEGAIEMAGIALKRGEHADVRRLARTIIRVQRAEIAALRPIDAALTQAGIPEGELGVQSSELDMGGDLHDLEEADPFDRTFIEMMVPHHESAVRMAAVELRNERDPRLRRLADGIVAAQRREIDEMKRWFTDWYGERPRAAGGDHLE